MRGTRSASAALVALTLVLTTLPACTTTASKEPLPRPTVVAVVDVQRAFDSLDEKAEIEAWREKQARDFKEEHDRKMEEIRKLGEDLGSSSKQALDKTSALDGWFKSEQRRILSEQTERLEAVRQHMLRTIAVIAERRRFDIVLNRETVFHFPNPSTGTSTPVTVKGALWHRDALDITDDVVGMMNNEFRNSPQK